MHFFHPVLITLLSCSLLWSCTNPENKTENPMDRPEVQQILFHPKKMARTKLPAAATDINIEVEKGITIGCRLFTADKNLPTILFFHGNGEVVSDYDAIGPLYIQHKMNLLVTDYRGYGWSNGTPSFSSLLADSHVLYAKVKQYLNDNKYNSSLFLMGRSLGSASAIELASVYNEEIMGLIIESGFALTLPLAETMGADIAALQVTEEQSFNNFEKIKKVRKPTFLLHGQRDTLIPLWQAEKLHAECGARSKELQIIPGADHNSLIAIGGNIIFKQLDDLLSR
ncbi:MAG: alpha/beta hydrolase [Candidatus Electrothrix sp. AR3]|nr:alpha/beta hydrolase [Candidatus Electrothrix sp. AR3]